MTAENLQILDGPQVLRKVSRIAHEIHENNYLEKNIIIVGIRNTGFTLAKMITEELKKISSAKIHLFDVKINKRNPANSEVIIDCSPKLLKNASVILVDDVLNTGRTFMYCLKPLLNAEVKKIETAVLINRSHALFPIFTKYCGYELATTLEDHVEVVLTGDETAVFLK